jgi:MFS family permease
MSQKTIPFFLLYLLTLILGSSFTMIPSSSGFLLSTCGMGLSKLDYGNVFILLISGALFTSYFGGIIAKNIGIKNLLIFGLCMSSISMGLFSLESLFLQKVGLSYPVLMLILFFLGTGYGAMMTSLSTYFLHRKGLFQNLFIALGMGACISPLLFKVCLTLGVWWAAPLVVACTLALLTIFVLFLFPKPDKRSPIATFSLQCIAQKRGLLLFVGMTVFYGICETLFSTWGIVFLKQDKGISELVASYSLFFFWFFVMLGRFVIAGYARLSLKKIFIALGVMLAIACIAAGLSSSTASVLIIFSLAGLGCSSLLPLIYQCCQKHLEGREMAISGMLGGMYIIGYGLSAAGVACIERRAQISFASVFIAVGILLIISIIILTWNRKAIKALS